MKICIYETKQLADAAAASLLLRKMRDCSGIIGLATGDTTRSVFEEAVRLYEADPFDLTKVHFSAVDDYCGIEKGHVASCAERIRCQLMLPLGLTDDHFLLPDRFSHLQPQAAAEAYEELLGRNGGVETQFLGIGEDGHLGFCRPDTPFSQYAHAVRLPQDTRTMLTRKYALENEKLPEFGVTLGLGSIMRIPEVMVIATGCRKADAVYRSIREIPTEKVPASILQEHANVTWIMDRDAAGLLQ